jgi:ABC-2 type transport system permease protein
VASTTAIYARLAASRVRGQFQYRLSFFLQLAGAFLLSFLDFVAIVVVFRHINHLADWTFGDVAFLYGTSYVSFKLADVVMTNMDKLPTFVRMGSFDQVLTRPLGTLGQVLTADIDLKHVGGIAQGAIVLWFALGRVDIDWTPQRAIVLASMLVSAVVIFCALWVLTNAIAFWTMDAREVANAFTYGGNFLTHYPLSIFATWMRRLLGYGFALGFVNYFPSQYLLDKPGDVPGPIRFMSPVAALGLVCVAAVVWRLAVRHYRSTGS